MEKKRIKLLLTKLHCYSTVGGNGKDEIYLKIYEQYESGGWGHIGTYFEDNPIQLADNSDDDDAYVDIEIDVTYVDRLQVMMYEADRHDSDHIGSFYFERGDTEVEGYKYLEQQKDHAKYHLYYRVIDKPIQTLRVFGVYCEEDSKGCNVDAVETVFAIAEKASEEASDLLKKSPRPRARSAAKAFEKASERMEDIANFVIWLADTLEGKDEVYLQHVDEDTHEVQGGPFWPQGSPGYYQMEKGDEVYFTSDNEGENVPYYRFPMDRGPVTIQLREEDPLTSDANIGAFTFNETYYNQYADQGSQVLVCDEYFGHSGQGALYYICASVGMENWALPPTLEAQEESFPEEIPDPDPETPDPNPEIPGTGTIGPYSGPYSLVEGDTYNGLLIAVPENCSVLTARASDGEGYRRLAIFTDDGHSYKNENDNLLQSEVTVNNPTPGPWLFSLEAPGPGGYHAVLVSAHITEK